ncbi:MAG: SGNH/GDSL hydrolase family protein, partial [Victivallaceae bacterium]|nr:SGNH/GDSL hydrolase family protein [Victivallaceae bacterium]
DLIKLIQNKIGGKIVLVSSTSSNYDLTKDNVERATKKRPDAVHVIFGPPKHMEAFNDVLIKLSKELGLDYLDIYQPMKARKDKASLLSDVDGVHLTEKGHSFIAFEFLKYIASQQK